jgi:DNA topoisomerase IB
VLDFAAALPPLRNVVQRHLAGPGLTRNRVLAAAIRLLDLGFFRPGGEEYAEENGTFGLATIRRDHVTISNCQLIFTYSGKGAKLQERAIADDEVCAVIRSLKRRRTGSSELLAYRSGTRWHDVSAADINDYLGEVTGGEFTAKDFRTWHATVLAAVALAVSKPVAASPTARKRAVARAIREVADYLGNTPAVARASYIDPRVITLYEQGITIESALARLGAGREFGELATHGHVEEAVLRMLRRAGNGTSVINALSRSSY